MVAMMLPSLFPTLLRYQGQVRRTDDVSRAGLRTMLAGTSFFLVWALLGVAAYAVGAVITTAEMRSFVLARFVPIATGMVLVLAGCFQLTRWKTRLLTRCRDEQACSMSRPASPAPVGKASDGESIAVCAASATCSFYW